MLCSAAKGSGCWCFYNIPAPLSFSTSLTLPRIIYSCHINAHFTVSAGLVFALVLLILDTVHQDPKGEWARSLCESICTWAHGLLFYILHVTGVDVDAIWTCGICCTSVHSRVRDPSFVALFQALSSSLREFFFLTWFGGLRTENVTIALVKLSKENILILGSK